MCNEYVQALFAAKQTPEPPRSKEAEEAGAALVYGTGSIEKYLRAKRAAAKR